jgi:hypothetical protein
VAHHPRCLFSPHGFGLGAEQCMSSQPHHASSESPVWTGQSSSGLSYCRCLLVLGKHPLLVANVKVNSVIVDGFGHSKLGLFRVKSQIYADVTQHMRQYEALIVRVPVPMAL